ncbi:MAG TPA: hypothetical protein PKD88_05290 [Nitrosomonas sp.]|nr:hypothetical protein [Nitrosomonas sp.]HMV13250.1 hypothetical protein [Nitrosomonas sp.]HMW20405.1 hypothetical protein [Nitrosomonas sp.]HMW68161.1 hypothetical protein [Nitrosomonas sp.]HMY60887.1 hypothetical protein [Nitrosomonas sp.]
MIHTQRQEQELSMLRSEIEMLMSERQSLLRTVGAAAVFIANLDDKILLGDICKSAKVLSASLNDLPEETLSDALEKVNSKFISCE